MNRVFNFCGIISAKRACPYYRNNLKCSVHRHSGGFSPRNPVSLKGFTSIELIIVILVLGVLAGSFLIRNPFSISDYSTIAADQVMADIQYVQTRAMGLGSQQGMAFANNSGTYCICDVPTCSVATCATTGETKTLPGDVLVTDTTFGTALIFNSLGEPTFGTGNGKISLSGGNITIYGITGKVEWSG